MILHTLCASPSSTSFRECLAVLAEGDCLLLLGDGVYAASPSGADWESLAASGAEIHVLQPDARAAGIMELADTAIETDMDGFVELSERCSRQMAWY